MRVTFLGVGEACDADFPNTSLLIIPAEDSTNHILLDCGFTTPHLYFQHIENANALQAVWISHFHGDHFFGMPLLLLRFWEMGRTAPLQIIGLPGIQKIIEQTMQLAYPGFAEKLAFKINYQEASPGTHGNHGDCTWSFAPMEHSKAAMALRLDSNNKSIFYSGDGRPTDASTSLAQEVDLAVHEAYRVNGDTPGHGSVNGCLEFAARAGVRKLALLHMSREERKSKKEYLNTMVNQASQFEILMPQPGTTLTI